MFSSPPPPSVGDREWIENLLGQGWQDMIDIERKDEFQQALMSGEADVIMDDNIKARIQISNLQRYLKLIGGTDAYGDARNEFEAAKRFVCAYMKDLRSFVGGSTNLLEELVKKSNSNTIKWKKQTRIRKVHF